MNEIDALKWYEGDVQGQDPVFSDPKAYVTLNAMFFDGLENERTKSVEHKRLNPAFLSRWNEIWGSEGICSKLFTLMYDHPLDRPRHVLRVERLSDYESMMQKGHTIAFTSTSETDHFLKAYGDKDGIVLMVFDLPQGIIASDLTALLPEYLKSEEAEILLPPYMKAAAEEIPLTDEEKEIHDRFDRVPYGKYQMHVNGFIFEDRKDAVINDSMITASMRVYEALNKQKEPSQSDIDQYLLLKQHIQYVMQMTFQKILNS